MSSSSASPSVQSIQLRLGRRLVTPADCLGYPTVSASARLLVPANTPPIGVMLSNSSSQRPFPWEYRQYSMMVNLLPALSPPLFPGCKLSLHTVFRRWDMPVVRQPGGQAARLRATADGRCGQQLRFPLHRPLTDLAWLLQVTQTSDDEITWNRADGRFDPERARAFARRQSTWRQYRHRHHSRRQPQRRVERLLGSRRRGNCLGFGHPVLSSRSTSPTASSLTPEVLNQWLLPAAQSSITVNLHSQMYCDGRLPQGGYSFWDTVTAAYLGNPDLFTFATYSLGIVTDESSPDLGNIKVVTPRSYPINVAQTVNVNGFYQ